MPELPEVEAARRLLQRAAAGRTLAAVHVRHPALARRLGAADRRALEGARVERVERRGKHQLVHLDGGAVLLAHFRMTGDWEVGRVGDPEPPYARALFEFTDGVRVALVDPRALSTLELRRAGAELGLPAMGPEADGPDLTPEWMARALARRRGPVKPALLDQRVVAGIGNIYASEALWRARISPTAPADSLGRPRLARLADALRETVRQALRVRGGRYARTGSAEHFAVYGREGEPCRRCGAAVARITQAGRSTFYCPRCQRR